jgi:stage II sporulation protein R
MKRVFLLLLCLLGVCFFLFKEDEIRVRVISNSDNSIDLKYKEEVVVYLKENILQKAKITDQYLKDNVDNIESELNLVFDNIVCRYEPHTFVNKAYNGNVVENGTYNTLLVYIGEANGSNWWGTIFEGSLKKESTEIVEYEWYFKRWI